MPVLPVWARWRAGELMLSVHVQPGARHGAILGQHGTRLKIRVPAPPVDGRANEELLRLLAGLLDLRGADLRIAAGTSSRVKTVAIRASAESAGGIVSRLLAEAE